jgi:hypothetical protein
MTNQNKPCYAKSKTRPNKEFKKRALQQVDKFDVYVAPHILEAIKIIRKLENNDPEAPIKYEFNKREWE